jgi:hypothetical protein
MGKEGVNGSSPLEGFMGSLARALLSAPVPSPPAVLDDMELIWNCGDGRPKAQRLWRLQTTGDHATG